MSSSPETPVLVGDRFKVELGEKGWFVATILERRPLRKVLKQMKGKNADTLEPTDYEYYVHYDHFDSRCDEWVDLDRIDSRISYPTLTSQEEEDDDDDDTNVGDGKKRKKKRKSLEQLRFDDRRLDVVFSKKKGKGVDAAASAAASAAAVASAGGGSRRAVHDSELSSSSGGGYVGGSRAVKGDSSHDRDRDSKGEGDAVNKNNKGEGSQVRNIQSCIIGKHEIKTWYKSNYPEDRFQSGGKLFLCEYCLDYKQNHSTLFVKHKCDMMAPPGAVIYRDDDRHIGVWEVDGKEHRAYCANLCSISKLFLDDKSIFNSTDNFYFYVLCEFDECGAHFVGYFSKEKESPQKYNVACIMVLPSCQANGYGKFLISLSYELSKIDGNSSASPEHPLSDLGEKAYMKYWCDRILRTLFDDEGARLRGGGSMREICRQTGIRMDDVALALQYMVAKTQGMSADSKPVPLKGDVPPAAYINAFLYDFAKTSFLDKIGRSSGYAKPEYLAYEAKPLGGG